jgi:isoprene-epoxide---glutathione S-transferase
MVTKLYQYVPGWTVPCISPYVSKVAIYFRMVGHPFELVAQDLSKLAEDAPRTKLPYIVEPDGSKIPDSNEIIDYAKKKYGDKLDQGISAEDKAVMVAWVRLIDEHLYWSGVIQPRWRMDSGWETYVPIICGGATQIPAEVRAGLDAFRAHIREEFVKQGMGLKSDEEVFETFKTDVDAMRDFLHFKSFFMGPRPTSVDAAVYSILTHTAESPFAWKGRDYIQQIAPFRAYIQRMRSTFDLDFSKASAIKAA